MIISSPDEMFALGKKYAKTHTKIALHGDLGAGKTLFTKWFAAGLEINKNIVQSPTYTYINTYENKLLHIDMYRLEIAEELVEKWILDEIHNFDHIIIERPKFEETIDYEDFLKLKIEKVNETVRKVKQL